MSALLIIFGLLNLADCWTTWQVFRYGGRERTPWIAWLISKIGLYWALTLVKVAAVGAVWYFRNDMPDFLLLVLDIAYGLQVWWNWQALQIQKSIGR